MQQPTLEGLAALECVLLLQAHEFFTLVVVVVAQITEQMFLLGEEVVGVMAEECTTLLAEH
jgi:hypothetical protein